MIPRGATHTTIVTEYLFAPEAVADPGFDPSPVVDFSELVARQDYDVCERVQRGVTSRAYAGGGIYARKDEDLWHFNARYLVVVGPALREIAQAKQSHATTANRLGVA